jgi:hypothetical protein
VRFGRRFAESPLGQELLGVLFALGLLFATGLIVRTTWAHRDEYTPGQSLVSLGIAGLLGAVALMVLAVTCRR